MPERSLKITRDGSDAHRRDAAAVRADLRERLGDERFARLTDRLAEVSGHIATRGILSYSSGARFADLYTGYSYGEFYDWDLYFDSIHLSHWGVSRYARTNVEAFLDTQRASGFVPRSLLTPRLRDQFKPFLAQTALLNCRQTGNFGWLAGRYYGALKKSVDYWFWHCDFDKNGLCVWDGAGHSGMDNHFRRLGVDGSMSTEGVDLNCYLLRELRALAEIARSLGKTSDAAGFDRHAEQLAAKIDATFWDEADGFYYDRHERTGDPVRIKSVAGFVPLWLGVAPPERAERLVREHLLNPDEFWLKHPVACWSKSEPDYYQQRKADECNWRGTTWIPTNYMVFQGLRRYGFEAEARELAWKTFDLVLNEETTREYYDGENGVGQGLSPFWGWSALAYFMPLELELGYDPTDVTRESLVPLACEVLGLTFPEVRAQRCPDPDPHYFRELLHGPIIT